LFAIPSQLVAPGIPSRSGYRTPPVELARAASQATCTIFASSCLLWPPGFRKLTTRNLRTSTIAISRAVSLAQAQTLLISRHHTPAGTGHKNLLVKIRVLHPRFRDPRIDILKSSDDRSPGSSALLYHAQLIITVRYSSASAIAAPSKNSSTRPDPCTWSALPTLSCLQTELAAAYLLERPHNRIGQLDHSMPLKPAYPARSPPLTSLQFWANNAMSSWIDAPSRLPDLLPEHLDVLWPHRPSRRNTNGTATKGVVFTKERRAWPPF